MRTLIYYLARRLAFAVFLVFAVSSASLVLARLAPGDFVTESLGVEALSSGGVGRRQSV